MLFCLQICSSLFAFILRTAEPAAGQNKPADRWDERYFFIFDLEKLTNLIQKGIAQIKKPDVCLMMYYAHAQ